MPTVPAKTGSRPLPKEETTYLCFQVARLQPYRAYHADWPSYEIEDVGSKFNQNIAARQVIELCVVFSFWNQPRAAESLGYRRSASAPVSAPKNAA